MSVQSIEGHLENVPLLSILIPAYNASAFLEDCLNSIRKQNPRFSLEILVLDDCSMDETWALAEQWSKRHGEGLILLRHERNRGLSAARNSLLAAARGRYVWFLDSDDYLLPGSLHHFEAVAEEHDPDMILFDFSRDDCPLVTGFDGPVESLMADREQLIRGVFATRKMFSWARISKRNLWDEGLRFPEGQLFEDVATTPWLLLRTGSYYYKSERWVHYRQHRASIVWRTRYAKGFDEKVNDGLAGALAEYMSDLTKVVGNASDPTRYAISHFQAKIFTQIGFHLLKSVKIWSSPPCLFGLLAKYRRITESASPFTFRQLRRHYLSHKRWEAFAALLLVDIASSIGRKN